MYRVWIAAGGVLGAGAVAMAAVAAHALAGQPAAVLRIMDSGVQIEGWHALALVATGVWAERRGGLAHWAAAGFLLGTVLFCGAVYLVALAGVSLGPVAPTGGMVLIAAWLLLALAAVLRR